MAETSIEKLTIEVFAPASARSLIGKEDETPFGVHPKW
jgi:hypothetical protein